MSLDGRALDYFTEKGKIMFKCGSEFLICAVKVKDQVKHVYIRQIELGWGEHVVFCLHDKVFKDGPTSKVLHESSNKKSNKNESVVKKN